MPVLIKSGFIALLLLAGSVSAATFYVHTGGGDDTNPGSEEAPFRTILKAVKAARPGDVIQLVPGQGPIHESVWIPNKSGEPGRPITLDGGGNLITACQPVNPAEWTEVKPGLYRNDRLLSPRLLKKEKPNTNEDILRRYFFVIGGKVNRMGRSSKGARPPLPPVEALKPGEWTYVDDETAFYLATGPGKTLAEAQVEAPLFQNGLATTGTCRHWVIRNLNVGRVINDAFNIHGRVSDFRFEAITATECGDDGMSAHEACEVEVHGFVARRNSTGICHVQEASSKNTAVVLEENHGANLLLLGSGTHEFKESVLSAEGSGIRLAEPKGEGLFVRLIDCKIPWPKAPTPGGKPPVMVAPGCHLELLGSTRLGDLP